MKSQLLREAKARIDTPDKWCKHAMFAVEADGNHRRCAIGAMHSQIVVVNTGLGWHVSTGTFSQEDHEAVVLLTRAVRFKKQGDVMQFNDAPDTTHADVMALYDRAIELAEAGEVWDELEATKAMEEPEPVKTMDTTKELVNV